MGQKIDVETCNFTIYRGNLEEVEEGMNVILTNVEVITRIARKNVNRIYIRGTKILFLRQ